MKTRNGKIAKLPQSIRDQLNTRLSDGQEGPEILPWLNAIPKVQEILKDKFDSQPITKQNLSEWRAGGYEDWLLNQNIRDAYGSLAEHNRNIEELEEDEDDQTSDADPEYFGLTSPTLPDKLALWLTARYMVLSRQFRGDTLDDASWKRFRELTKDVIALRRGDHQVRNLDLKEKQMEHNRLEEMGRALEMCLKDSRKYPDVVTQFKLAFRMLKNRRNGDYTDDDEEEASTEKASQTGAPTNAGQTESNQVQPSPEPDESPEPVADPIRHSTFDIPARPTCQTPDSTAPTESPTQSNPVKPSSVCSSGFSLSDNPTPTTQVAEPPETASSPICHSSFVIPSPSRESLLAEADQCLWQMKTNFEPWDLEKLRQLYSAIPPLWDDVPLPSYLTDQTPDQLRQQAEQCVWRMRNNFEPWNNEVLRRVFSLVPPEKPAPAQEQP
jgi:hypothetical protein